jgi:hypothetical protein
MKGSEIANQLVPDNGMSVRNDVEPRTLLGVNGSGVSKIERWQVYHCSYDVEILKVATSCHDSRVKYFCP